MNPGDIVGARGVHYYWSLGAAPISQYYTELGLTTRRTAYSYRSLEQRAPLYALAAVKYYIGREGTEPYGFRLVEGYELKHSPKRALLFENENALPLGYTYDAFFSATDFHRLPLAERQEALLEGAVLPDETITTLPDGVQAASLESTQRSVPVMALYDEKPLEATTDIELSTRTSTGELSLSFEGLPNSETYIVLHGLSASRSVGLEGHWGLEERLQINVASGERKTHLKLSTDYFKWTTGQHDFLISLGYSREGRTEATLTLPPDTSYTIEGIEIVCQPMNDFASQINSLRENTLESVELSPNTVTGTISLDRSKILCLSIPYDKGWRAEVDGEAVEPIRANVMFMALPLTPGEHSIALYYETAGLRWGAIASSLGFTLFALVLILRRIITTKGTSAAHP
jgi:Predicted membrane protein